MHYVRGLKDARLAAKALELPVEHLTREMAANMDEQVLRPMRFVILTLKDEIRKLVFEKKTIVQIGNNLLTAEFMNVVCSFVSVCFVF